MKERETKTNRLNLNRDTKSTICMSARTRIYDIKKRKFFSNKNNFMLDSATEKNIYIVVKHK